MNQQRALCPNKVPDTPVTFRPPKVPGIQASTTHLMVYE